MGILISLAVFFSAIIIHEFSHAFAAYHLGDTTAARHGRLTLNPIAHIDPFGTILLPILLIVLNSPVLFGWAKPVPINFRELRNPKRDMTWVGLAGPASNILLAVCATLLLKTGLKENPVVSQILVSIVLFNVVLAVFNLVPIPPLDGSRILMGLLPMPMAVRLASLERYGFIILFALIYLGFFNWIILPVVAWIIYFLSLL